MYDFENLDHYQILGISRSAGAEEIKKAYRREIAHYHPDHYQKASPDEQSYARARSQRITEAYRVLNDFAARTRYNAESSAVSVAANAAAPATGGARTDQLDALYVQAERLLRDGRPKEALDVLKRLEQIDPFYRDSAELRWRAESRATGSALPVVKKSRRGKILLLLALLAVILAVLVVFLGSGSPEAPAPTSTIESFQPLLNPSVTAEGATPSPEVIATSAPPTEAPSPSVPPATEAQPSPEPSQTAEASPTPEQAASATSAPPTATSAPPTATSDPADNGDLTGPVLVEDNFSIPSWSVSQGGTWVLNYINGSYHMAMDAGVSTLWSYSNNNLAAGNVSVSVDVTPLRGYAGLLFGFVNGDNYYRLMTAPDSSYKLERRSGGVTRTLTSGEGAGDGRLTFALVGSTLRIYFNTVRIDEVALPSVPRGSYGFVISSEGAAEAYFDNLRIRRIQ